MYPPQDTTIHAHLSRVTPSPNGFPPGLYWYGTRHSPGHPPNWVQKLLSQDANELDAGQPESRSVTSDCEVESEEETDHGPTVVTATLRPKESRHYFLRSHITAPHRLKM